MAVSGFWIWWGRGARDWWRKAEAELNAGVQWGLEGWAQRWA